MRKFTKFLVLALVCLCVPKAWSAAADESIYRQVLFNMGDYDSQYWRIPALTVAEDGALVAVVDKRGSALGDLPNTITLMSRRSTDGGRTWSEPVVVAQGGNGKTYGDAALITERESGKIICMYVGDRGFFASTPYDRAVIYYSTSEDNGLSWSDPVAINNQIYANHSDWYAAFAASGRGTQLENGRIIFTLAVRPNSNQTGYVDNWTIYSDDKGVTWKTSNNRATAVGNEAKTIELKDGTVLMSIRNYGKGYRLFCKSEDKGATWGTHYSSTTLKDADCNGDIIRCEYEGKSYLVHSLPNSSTTRENVSLFVSADEGESWRLAKQLVDGYSAYSSMVELPDGTIAVLVEEGKWDGNLPGTDGFTLVYYNFSKEWLFENINTGGNGSGDELTGTLPLNGVDQYMRIPYAEELHPQLTNGGYTVTFDAKVAPEQSGVGYFVSTRYYEGTNNDNTVGYDLVSNGDDQYGINLSLSSGAWGKGNSGYQTYASGEWHHFSWVYNMVDGTSKLYIDGVEKNSKTLAEYKTATVDNGRDIYVGAGYTTNQKDIAAFLANYLNGEIDNLHFYQKALSSTEVTTDMTSFDLADAKANLALKAAYDFEGITGNTVTDLTGNGHDAALVNYNVAVKTYVVNVTDNGVAYTLTADGEAIDAGSVPSGTELTLTVTEPEGKAAKVTWNGTELEGEGGVFKFTVEASGTLVISLVIKQDPNNYCVYGYAEKSQAVGQRYLRSITLNNQTQGTTFTISSIESSTTHDMYHDFSADQICEAYAGDVIQPSVDHASNGEWLHCYFFIDYNQDKAFSDGNTDKTDVYYPFYFTGNVPQEGSELVSYPFYSPTESSSGYNSKGESSSNNPWFNNLPSFTLPASLKSGDYRVRFNITWNELDPCAELWAPQDGNAAALNNRMDQVGGSMTDFTIRIKELDAIDAVVAESAKVYGAEGEIVVENESLATVHIYTANGVLAVAPFQVVGTKAVKVPAGMYIVKVADVAKLVVVK